MGGQPILTEEYTTIDEAVASAEAQIEKLSVVKKADKVIISGGLPIGQAGHTNLLRVMVAGEE